MAPTQPPDPAETPVYQESMAQAREARDRAERIVASLAEPKAKITRPA
jgi:hypothetical protein